MTEKMISAIVTICLGIIGVAVIAMLVSKSSDTVKVTGAAAGGLACLLKTVFTGQNACGGGSPIEDVNSTITFPPMGGGRGGLFQ
jgi:hypothetical protein